MMFEVEMVPVLATKENISFLFFFSFLTLGYDKIIGHISVMNSRSGP